MAPQRKLLILPPRFLASVDVYAAMYAADTAIVDISMPFNKRDKATHRATILDANGDAFVTVPIEKPISMSHARWADIRVSGHGAWWNIAMTALRSAYGRTPYFEFYADDFQPILSADSVGIPLVDLNRRLDQLLRLRFGIETPTLYTDPESFMAQNPSAWTIDDRRHRPIDFTANREYYQIRADKYGFRPHLSAVDLLFNMGPESILVLRDMCR